MKTGRGFVAFSMAVALVLAGCGDPSGPEDTDPTGTWNATSAIVGNPAQAGQEVDLLELGFAFELVIAQSGDLEAHLTMGGSMETQTGTLELSGDAATMVLDGTTYEGTFELGGDVLRLDFRSGLQWDFDDDGIEEPATLLLVLARQE